MSDIPGLPEGSISRVLILSDLGTVRKGDHLIVVGGKYAIAVDTSRQPGDPVFVQAQKPNAPAASPAPAAQAQPQPRKAYTRRAQQMAPVAVTPEHVMERINSSEETTARQIGDELGLERDDLSNRAKITRFLQILRQEQKIRIVHKNGNYVVYTKAAPAASPDTHSAPLGQSA